MTSESATSGDVHPEPEADSLGEQAIKADLLEHLGRLHTAILGKLDGLGEYDLRRPLTPTGTNLLGVVKHLASVEAGYLGDCLGDPWPHELPWFAPDAPINADMWASEHESSQEIRDFYTATWELAQRTCARLPLAARGFVPWWPQERCHPTLAQLLTHLSIETARHAGHLDIVRELIDETAGRYAGEPSMPGAEEIDWPRYREQVEAAAKAAAGQGAG